MRAGPSPKVRIDGLADIPPVAGAGVQGFITLHGPAYLRTVPAAFAMEPNRIYILEFDYRIIERGGSPNMIALLSLYGASDTATRRNGRMLNAATPDKGRFVGGIKTGSAATPYVLEFIVPEGTVIAVGELTFYEQRSVPRDAEHNPLHALSRALYPRLGNYQGGMPDAIAFDGCGTVKSGLPLMSTDELERRLALFDVIAGFDPSTSTSDPSFGKRIRLLNPGIALLPYTIAAEQGMFDGTVSILSACRSMAVLVIEDQVASDQHGEIARDSMPVVHQTQHLPVLSEEPAGAGLRRLFREPVGPAPARGW
jgi:hypothetical protein